MNAKVTKWIINSLIQKCGEEKVLEHLLTALPLDGLHSRLKKVLLLWRIRTELYKGGAYLNLLDLLELVGDLGKTPSEKMREAYCGVAVDCTVRYLELGDFVKYDETVQKIWRGRIMWEMGSSGLVDEKTLAWGDDIEAARSDEEFRGKILSMNNRCRMVKAVKRYLAEACEEVRPFSVEMTAKEVFNEILGGVIGEEGRCQGMEDINDATKFDDDNGDEQGFMDNVNEARNGVVSSGPCEKLSEGEIGKEQAFDGSGNVNERTGLSEKLSGDEIGEEQGFEASENVNKADIGIAPAGPCEKLSEDEIMEEDSKRKACNDVTFSGTCEKPSAETSHRQLKKRLKSIGVRKVVACKNRSKSLLSDSEDTRMNKDPCISSPVSSSEYTRRPPRKWTVVEEDRLRQAVGKHGIGKWKTILYENSHVFEGRTEVDLKDKWRNLTR